ncbi:MAG: PaaI family thioesterase, partial [Paracoccaceae bacterium]
MMVEAIGETDHVGRSTGVAQGKIVGVENGRLYATASTTCMVIKLEPPKSN